MTDTEGPSLTDVLDWSQKASLFIAMQSVATPEMHEALNSVVQLTELARLALSSPTEGHLRKAITEDPYCHAAYAYGAKETLRRIEAER
jgi:hypothetical protein